MTAEAQRIAIAESCGIQVVPCTCTESPWKDAVTGKHIPDYLNDLNACHEAERAIGLHGDNFRGRMLRRSWGTYTAFLDSRFLTASERAQALLMTIKKWTYDN